MSSPPPPRYQCSRFTNDRTIPLADYQALLHEHCLSHELGKLKAAGRDFSMWLYCPEVHAARAAACCHRGNGVCYHEKYPCFRPFDVTIFRSQRPPHRRTRDAARRHLPAAAML